MKEKYVTSFCDQGKEKAGQKKVAEVRDTNVRLQPVLSRCDHIWLIVYKYCCIVDDYIHAPEILLDPNHKLFHRGKRGKIQIHGENLST